MDRTLLHCLSRDEVSLGAVGNSGLVRVALPCLSSFAPHDPLLAGFEMIAPFKALKLELNSCSPVPLPSPRGLTGSGAQVEVGAGLCPRAAQSLHLLCANSSFALTSSEVTVLPLLLGFPFRY